MLEKLTLTTASLLLVACASATNDLAIGQAASDSALPPLIAADMEPPVVDFANDDNFRELRAHFAQRADFRERCELSEQDQRYRAAVEQNDFETALSIAQEWLAKCPVLVTAHGAAAAANAALNRDDAEQVHARWLRGLTHSMMENGDGHTPDTAFPVISIGEEYWVMRILRLTNPEQAMVDTDQGPRDALTGVDAEGNEQTVYFNPYWHFVRLEHLLGPDQD